MLTKSPAQTKDLGSIELQDEAEWLDACGAAYETAIFQVAGSNDPLSVIFVPGTGHAGVARRGEAQWLRAASLDDAVERYLRGEGTPLEAFMPRAT